jgi:hypothetical protein
VSDEDAERIVREQMAASAKPKGWVCEICGKEFRSANALRGHMAGKHKTGKRKLED